MSLIHDHSMSSQQIIRQIPAAVTEKIRLDFNSNAIKFYRFDEVPEVFIDRQVLNSNAGNKSTCAVVGLSSCPGDERDYEFLSWLRLDVDKEKKEYVTDIDPIAFYFKSTTTMQPTTAVALFHQKYEGRTEPELPIKDDQKCTLTQLRETIQSTAKPFEEADERFASTMEHVANIIRKIDPPSPSTEE